MILITYPLMLSIASGITAIGTAYLTVKRIAHNYENSKAEHSAILLQSAKEADSVLKVKIDSKIHDLELQIENLKENTEKDLSHLKEIYTNEIHTLGAKIETLRDELTQHHAQLLQVLTKLIQKD